MAAIMQGQRPRRTNDSQRSVPGSASTIQFVYSLTLLILLWLGWRVTARPVTVTVDGLTDTVYTHRHTVALLLTDLGVNLGAHEKVTPQLDATLQANAQVTVARARQWRILADSRDFTITSWGETPRTILEDATIAIEPYDEVVIGGARYTADQVVPAMTTDVASHTFRRGYAWDYLEAKPLQMRVRRATEFTVDEGGLPYALFTTAQTVGEALRQADVTLYLGDRVIPSLGSSVAPGMRVYIQRSTPATLTYDGRVMKTRTRATTVGEALGELGIAFTGLDKIQPPLETKLFPDIKVKISRVREEIEVEEEITSFETIFRGDPNLPIDQQEIAVPGAEGITRNRFRVRYEDEVQVDRVLEDRWLAQSPTERVISYGQQLTPQTFTAADGTQITYWRKIKMLASSYSADTSGVASTHPHYGLTFSGERMRQGVVAVDLKVIPLRTRVYVPGYGIGDALDTGSAIRSRRIDLGYDDGNLVLWNKWVDVYLLWPPPSAGEITWVIPNFPKPPNE